MKRNNAVIASVVVFSSLMNATSALGIKYSDSTVLSKMAAK